MSSSSFRGFFHVWAVRQGWNVPWFHWVVVDWLDQCDDPVRVMLIFRGAAKSTIYAVRKAYLIWKDRTHRSLVWSEDTKLARKMTRDVIHVLRNHPWCGGIVPPMVGSEGFWVYGSNDARNPTMTAHGVLSNATGSRADSVDFDDIEVPKNIRTVESREKLRERISESTHIIVPGGQKTYIGTPHTHNSIYTEQVAGGAAVLKIPLFAHQRRFEDTTTATRYPIGFPIADDGLYVMTGIGQFAKLLKEGTDYTIEGNEVVFPKPPAVTFDLYAGCAWPERFTRRDIEIRRKGTRTLNAWDSQYMLEAKPMQQVRLDPDKMIPYDVEPVIREANSELAMHLGGVRIVSATLRMDPSAGKVRSDVSALALVLQDEAGRLYWHRAIALQGDLAMYSDDGKTMIGGQVMQVCDVIEQFQLPRVIVETNGLGTHVPAILRGAFKQRGLLAGVTENDVRKNKNARILAAFEPPLKSGYLWAHVSVLDVVTDQMRDWNPLVLDQADDYLDSGAGAIEAEPVRIGQHVIRRKLQASSNDTWHPNAGVFEVEFDAT